MTNEVTVKVSPTFVSESGDVNIVFSFVRTGDISSALNVNFNIGGSTNIDDYTSSINLSPQPVKLWSKSLTTGVDEEIKAITTGNDGAIYVGGFTLGNLDNQINSGNYDTFVTKYLPDGTKSWTKLLGSTATDEAAAMTTGGDGAIYISGVTQGNLDGQINSGSYDAFITKYLPDGTKSWTRLLGSSSVDGASALTTGTDGAIYVSGITQGSLDGQINSGGLDAFITKYLPDGTKSWTRLLGSSSADFAYALTTGTDGAIYVSGATEGKLDGQINSGFYDVFITKYLSDGTKQWTKSLGSKLDDIAYALTTGSDGAIYVSGTSQFDLDGQINRQSSGLVVGGVGDVFITKYMPDGTKQWTRLLGTGADDIAYALTTGTDGAIYVSGKTLGSLDGQNNLGVNDVFIAKYLPDGTKSWSTQFGTYQNEMAYGLTTGSDGAIYVGDSNINFVDSQKKVFQWDGFISKYLVNPQINFAAGSSSAQLVIDPTPDAQTEGIETIVITITPGDGYLPSEKSFVATATVNDTAKFWKDNTKAPTDTKKADAVNLTDAIAILKMIVGLNVNGNNTPLSPYQAIAADFDQDGSVGLTDAIGVLKMVVGLSAPTPTWKYYDDTKLASAYTSAQSLNPKGWTTTALISDATTADSSVKLVGVLTGDVDGSWTGV